MRNVYTHPLVRQWVRFVGFGALMTPVSFGLYMALIHWANLGVMTSSVLRAICMTPVIFLVSRYLTWRQRRHMRGFWHQFRWYVFGRPVTLVLHQLIVLGTVMTGIHHAYAYWIAVSLTGLFNFHYGERFSFAAGESETAPGA